MTILEEQPALVEETKADNPIFTHIIDRGDDERSAEVIIMEARVNGTPLVALCGFIFVPQRDPKKHPVCEPCLEMYHFAKDFRN